QPQPRRHHDPDRRQLDDGRAAKHPGRAHRPAANRGPRGTLGGGPAPASSLPPCGGGPGWGVVSLTRSGATPPPRVAHPPPSPSPARGEGTRGGPVGSPRLRRPGRGGSLTGRRPTAARTGVRHGVPALPDV